MHIRKQHDPAAGNQNQSGRFLKPVKLTLYDIASQQAGETDQASMANHSGRFYLGNPQNTSRAKTAPKHLKNLSSFEQEKP
jgi:hypothetical protein